MNCIALYCIVLYCIVLYCTLLSGHTGKHVQPSGFLYFFFFLAISKVIPLNTMEALVVRGGIAPPHS
jgi:energy-converting hydrogenase Eha subunit G